LLSLAIPKLLGDAIDLAVESGATSRLLVLALTILGFAALRGGVAYGQAYFGESLSHRVAYDLRNAFFAKLLQMSFSFYDHQKTGDLMSKATVDIEGTRRFISMGVIRFFYLLFLMGGVTVLIVRIDRGLALMGLAAVLVAILYAVGISRVLRRTWLWVHREMGTLTMLLQENLSGARVVRAFAAQKYEEQKFYNQAKIVSDGTFKALNLHSFSTSFLVLVFTAVIAVVLWFGGGRVIDGIMTVGQLTQFIFYLGLVIFQARLVGFMVNSFARAASTGQRIFEVLDAVPEVRDGENALHLDKVRGQVNFEDVSFAYDSQAPAIRDVSFEVLPGEKVAILGAPGSGKTTIIHLLPRFYDVSHGRVTVDDRDVRDVSLVSLRRNIGLVFQDVFLFSASIHENIAFGTPDATREDVIEAARAAQLHGFVETLPEGYDTHVGERGVSLSGGQRQRLAIARTLLLDPPILVLDDSTSSVDPETEQLLQKALTTVMERRSTFIIAHRVSSVKEADLILVMQDGRIAERGTHRGLLEREGLYRQIYELQLMPEEGNAVL
jgi:ATP-binding cassette subfamily B protein